MRRLSTLLLAVLTMLGVVAAPAAAAPDGTLTLARDTVRAGQPITVEYTTPRPHPKNWLGLYTEPGNGPVDETYVGPSLRWVYIPDAEGTATLPTEGLEPGDYIVYGLAEDGYRWLAEPVRLRLTSAAPPRFVTGEFDLRNARAKAPYRATVRGLVRGDTQGLRFRKLSGPGWVTVAADGTVSGTPHPAYSAKTSTLRVEARNGRGEKDTAKARIEVRPPGARLVPELKVLSWNLWHGGSQVNGAREKQLRFLLESDVDAVGMQETSSASGRVLAEALGWDYYQAGHDLAVISRYPIVGRGESPAESGLAGMSARIRIDEQRGQDVVLWNVHLGYTPYGPYDACFGGMSREELLANEQRSGRTGQITEVLAAMRPELAESDATPVLLTGDFNAPSHLDWTPGTRRCGYSSVDWPTSVLPRRAGLRDSFRVANPDPVAEPGTTWSPIFPTFQGGYGYDEHKGEPEPQDRIDFVHFAGELAVTESRAVVAGDPEPAPNHEDNEWTSDHAAVLTTFQVT
ncbi:endonuclease/exonuclease/phosphatase family protein [Amycolatopsis cihanbeyliensis]|uniref:Exonuclease III n=1 Tax=Amycolatopsis cihanbeyliensis TaxID=1128664 RepID=A0A542DS29_AMYCI|nr:endonuclease/exonuclease/phosphatase family protein [Amycolatopsis cihanbeyliensis]TQJ05796.1 exonuclease III [Amycolatopsis cihanbeyliensis]